MAVTWTNWLANIYTLYLPESKMLKVFLSPVILLLEFQAAMWTKF